MLVMPLYAAMRHACVGFCALSFHISPFMQAKRKLGRAYVRTGTNQRPTRYYARYAYTRIVDVAE
jgi:hypothetical protein